MIQLNLASKSSLSHSVLPVWQIQFAAFDIILRMKSLKFIKATVSPKWRLFISDDITENAPKSVTSFIDSYTLPSGEVIKPVEIELSDEHFDIKKIVPHHTPDRSCALAVGTITAEEDGMVLCGAGADWWWIFCVNGEMVFGRPRKTSGGNIRASFSKSDWIFPIKLHKGENVVAIHIHSGMNWSFGTGLFDISEDFAGVTLSESAGSGDLKGLELYGYTTKNPIRYNVGEDMEFVFELRDPLAASSGKLTAVAWNAVGDDGESSGGVLPISTEKPARIHTSVKRPGFVHVTASLVMYPYNQETSSIQPFEGGAGAELERLAPVATKPEDFEEYWTRQRAKLDAVPMNPEKHLFRGRYFPDGAVIPESLDMYTVKLGCAGPAPVTGFLAMPKAEGKYPVRVVFDGYTNVPVSSHRRMDEGIITFHINAHGYELLRDKAYYDEFFKEREKNGPYGLSPIENKDPDTAYFNGMVMRVMRAFDFVKTLPEWNGVDLIASGGSQGGLQAVWAASLVEGITRCESYITWCSNISGKVLDGRLPGWHPEYVRGLDYYDTVFHAAHIPESCFVDFERIGLGDYTCPPSGVTMVYNAVRGNKRAAYYQNSTHCYVPPLPEIIRVRK